MLIILVLYVRIAHTPSRGLKRHGHDGVFESLHVRIAHAPSRGLKLITLSNLA